MERGSLIQRDSSIEPCGKCGDFDCNSNVASETSITGVRAIHNILLKTMLSVTSRNANNVGT
jgi:hypothetical protein